MVAMELLLLAALTLLCHESEVVMAKARHKSRAFSTSYNLCRIHVAHGPRDGGTFTYSR